MQDKKLTYGLIITMLLALMAKLPLSAQSPFDPAYADAAGQLVEHVQVFTDRSLYAVEESILFVADCSMEGLKEDGKWSNILYVELLSAAGKTLVQKKYKLTEGKVRASLPIPSGALTGNYFLKCYTRWMRNLGPAGFSYTPLKIINPYRTEVSSASNGASSDPAPGRFSYRKDILSCSTSSPDYRDGQEVLVKILLEEQLISQALECCITVVPEGAIDLSSGQYKDMGAAGSGEPFKVSYLPDHGRGLSISGSVVGPDQLPVPYTTLHFSLLGEHPDYFAAISDENGRFNLANTSLESEQEFFITPEQYEVKELEVRIDQEYDTRTVYFPSTDFGLTDEENELARKLALNMQLSKAYRPEKISVEDRGGQSFIGNEAPFYGTRVSQLLIDDYVMLPNLEEIFINLVPNVQIFRKRGKNGIRIMSDNNSIGVYQPLIMIDNIPVFDIETILSLSTEKIERIDLINDIYLKGSVPFGGVLAIYSRMGDMAGIDLPSGSYFFDFQGISPLDTESQPALPEGARIPDTRNTIYWNSDIKVDRENPGEISFRAPAGIGTYVVLVRAVSPDGEIFSATDSFSVK